MAGRFLRALYRQAWDIVAEVNYDVDKRDQNVL
jgi:hypothetical protein